MKARRRPVRENPKNEESVRFRVKFADRAARDQQMLDDASEVWMATRPLIIGALHGEELTHCASEGFRNPALFSAIRSGAIDLDSVLSPDECAKIRFLAKMAGMPEDLRDVGAEETYSLSEFIDFCLREGAEYCESKNCWTIPSMMSRTPLRFDVTAIGSGAVGGDEAANASNDVSLELWNALKIRRDRDTI